ncbi:MAG: hypothetical protein RL616_873 [Verrucomicrobiota bacterium]
MNEPDASNQTRETSSPLKPDEWLGPPRPPLAVPKPFSWWLRKFFACNPFYLVSAALLLYGCYRVSLEAPMFNLETARLLFNFTSVQLYEVLLVGTAIFLARRKIWYDSTLLVGLENLLVFVPFILISLAALIDSGMAMTMCLVGAIVAALRFGSLKKYFPGLNLPGRLLEIGLLLLALNVALPLLYRHFGETKIGIHIASGPAYVMNEFTWLLILPAVLALANFLPRAVAGGDLPPQHRWLPIGMFASWLAVTGAHLYALAYVYQFEFRSELFAPALWVLAWTACRVFFANQFLPRYALLIPPLLMPLFATNGPRTFLILAGLNVLACIAASLLDRNNRLARHLAFASALLLFAGLPEKFLFIIHPDLDRIGCLQAAVAAYLIFLAAWSRNPKLAIFGSLVFGASVLATLGNHANAFQWAVQGGCIFLLLHSLRWNDEEHSGAGFVRALAALVWVIQSVAWMSNDTGRFWMPLVPGATVLGICLACQFHRLQWMKIIVPLAALLVTAAGPCSAIIGGLRAASAGLLAVAGSFLLFGIGTIVALTRHHWHQPEDPKR